MGASAARTLYSSTAPSMASIRSSIPSPVAAETPTLRKLV